VDPRLPLERRAQALWDWWLGGATFFQEPGYPYLVGLSYWLAGPEPWAVYAWQLLVGLAGVAVVHRLALRLHSHTAAAVAGLLAVLAPVPLYLEIALLRDALVAWLGIALALLMAWTVEGPRRRWLLLGLALGAATLVKQTFLVFPVLLGGWRLATAPAPWRSRLAAAGLLTAGMALSLSPAIGRNLAVGVPPLALAGNAGAILPMHHAVSAVPLGAMWGDDYVEVLAASDARPLQGLVAALRTHPDPWSVLALEARKLAYAFHGYEQPNNVDLALVEEESPLVAALPAVLLLLVPLAAAGLSGAGRRAWPAAIAVAASLPTMIVVSVTSRYRAQLTAALLPLAGVGAVQLAAWVRDRRPRPLAAAAALTAAYLALATTTPPGRSADERVALYRSDAEAFAQALPAYAVLNLEAALRLRPGDDLIEFRLAQLRRAARSRRAQGR
jgi:4-amino-4-deoxy-L-arabinose transferase-like glycosyltransferase